MGISYCQKAYSLKEKAEAKRLDEAEQIEHRQWDLNESADPRDGVEDEETHEQCERQEVSYDWRASGAHEQTAEREAESEDRQRV